MLCNTDWFTSVKLAEIQSSRVPQSTRPQPQKKKLIRRPKGTDWSLQDEMGLTNDEIKYRRIIVCISSLIASLPNS